MSWNLNHGRRRADRFEVLAVDLAGFTPLGNIGDIDPGPDNVGRFPTQDLDGGDDDSTAPASLFLKVGPSRPSGSRPKVPVTKMKSPSRTAREYPTTGSQGEPDEAHFRPFRSVTVNFTWGVIGTCSRRANSSQSCAITLDRVAQTSGRSNQERHPRNRCTFAKTGAARAVQLNWLVPPTSTNPTAGSTAMATTQTSRSPRKTKITSAPSRLASRQRRKSR